SALLSAGAAGFLFLVAHESMRDFEPRLRLLGAAAGAVLAGFGFTNWQNSNETEVYAVATFTIAAMSWLALLWRRRRGEPRAGRPGLSALAGLLVAAAEVAPYLYLYTRPPQHPPINEAAPATLHALLAVIRRAQYPPRTPLDDPTLPSGAGNPGRSLSLLLFQVLDYVVCFDWQWAKSVRSMLGPLPVRTLVSLVFL